MKYCPTKRFLSAFAVALLLLAGTTLPVAADILRHKDGTNVHGKIIHETPDLVRIETSYGMLSYPKEDLTKIERSSPASAVPTPRVNYATVIPAGPVNPANPPQVAPLVRFASKPATTTTIDTVAAPAVPVGIPTPVAPAVPAASPPALPGTAPVNSSQALTTSLPIDNRPSI